MKFKLRLVKSTLVLTFDKTDWSPLKVNKIKCLYLKCLKNEFKVLPKFLLLEIKKKVENG